ncbi:MAG: hypothetical protein ACOY4K_05710 [Pseudomonadota bacterium]
MRVAILLGLTLLLGACNRVHTSEPLFFASDAPDAPRFREGVWLIETPIADEGDDGKPCRVDARKPVTRWPKCADWALVRGGEFTGYERDDKGGEARWESMAYVLAGGSPPVLQLATPEADGKLDYQYFGVRVTRRAADGRIEAYDSWPVLCGPPPPEGTKKADGTIQYATLNPLPGLTVVDDNCTTDQPSAVLNAASASLQWTAPQGGARWIRDTYP